LNLIFGFKNLTLVFPAAGRQGIALEAVAEHFESFGILHL
jgi:hypothetical protein